jgi:RsiW-degrading membrane proteinase PrsW (M82 family)
MIVVTNHGVFLPNVQVLMRILLMVGSAIVPALLLLWWFYKRDVNPEPRDVLLKTFARGMLIIIPVIVVAVLPMIVIQTSISNPFVTGLLTAFTCAALPEEFFKYRVLTRYSARHPAFDEPMDGVVYGAAASLGFAALENVIFVLGEGWEVAIARAVTAVPLHASLGAIMGYYVGQARFTPGWSLPASRGYWVAVLLHGLYDLPLLALEKASENAAAKSGQIPGAGSDLSGVADGWVMAGAGMAIVVGLIAVVWTLGIVRRLRREQLAAVSKYPA